MNCPGTSVSSGPAGNNLPRSGEHPDTPRGSKSFYKWRHLQTSRTSAPSLGQDRETLRHSEQFKISGFTLPMRFGATDVSCGASLRIQLGGRGSSRLQTR
jgi:hypothetical protein